MSDTHTTITVLIVLLLIGRQFSGDGRRRASSARFPQRGDPFPAPGVPAFRIRVFTFFILSFFLQPTEKLQRQKIYQAQDEGYFVAVEGDSRANRARVPDACCGRHAFHAYAVFEDCSAPNKSNAGHQALNYPCGTFALPGENARRQ